MANEAIKLYQFYRRYKWTENDFDGWQQGMVDQGRGMFEGLFGGAVLEGFAPSLTGGLNIDVSAGIASGPTGFLNVVNAVTALVFTAPSADNERALVVVRPDLTNTDYITKPTDPNITVPLTMEQRSVVEIIRGTPAASPSYPATEANDVVLFGVRLESGQVTLADVDIDFEVRDLPGKNSNFQQDAAKYDDRLRPFRYDNQTVGVKPSQLAGPFGRVFSYVNKKYPSIYPQDSSNNYNHADTYFNMTTGAITGGDEITANFTPTIPTAGNAIVATVAIDTNDEAVVTYGTAGTRAECLTGIKDQNTASAGSVNIQDNTKPIAFVICYSDDGASITEIDVIDCRGMIGTGTAAAGIAGGGNTSVITLAANSVTEDDDGKVVFVDTSDCPALNGTDYLVVQLAASCKKAGFKVTLKDVGFAAGTYPIWIIGLGGAVIEDTGLNNGIVIDSDGGSVNLYCDGTTYYFI